MVVKNFKRKNWLEKLYLKITNKKNYRKYKNDLKEEGFKLEINAYLTKEDSCNPSKSLVDFKNTETINVLHSGNSGDIIYSLPTLKKLYEITGKRIRFYLNLNQPLILEAHYTHPLGNVMLNEKMAEMLKPLLDSQSYIEKCEVYFNQRIDLNLDNFRNAGLKLDRGDIARWCGYITGINPELHIPWIDTESNTIYFDSIVIARSERYRNPFIDYSFLSKYRNLIFLGVESEYLDMKELIPNIKWVQVKSFLELAHIIKGCKFFIGNQSFPFSIAEGLKVPRILETYALAPNVIPQGPHANDFYYQNHFEWLVANLNGRSCI